MKCQIYWSCCKFSFNSKQNKRQNLLNIFKNGTTLQKRDVFLSVTLSCLVFGYWPGLYQNSAANQFSFIHSIIVYPKPSKVSYIHTLGTQFSCFLSITDYPQNLVESNNCIKYFTFDKTGYIANSIKEKKNLSRPIHNSVFLAGCPKLLSFY